MQQWGGIQPSIKVAVLSAELQRYIFKSSIIQATRMRHLGTAAAILILSAALALALPSAMPSSSSDQLASTSPPTSNPTDGLDKERVLNVTQKDVNEQKNATKNWKPIESHLDNPNYFEGDLDISQEMIDAFYGKPNDTDVSNIRYIIKRLYQFFFYCEFCRMRASIDIHELLQVTGIFYGQVALFITHIIRPLTLLCSE